MYAGDFVEVQLMNEYFAHSANKHGDWHRLKDHLRSVGDLASDFLDGLKGKEEARLAGLLHDLGKYGDRFQNRLHGKDRGLDHWSQGAWLSLKKCDAVGAALAIQGHHIGLQHLQKVALRRLDPEKFASDDQTGIQLSEKNLGELESRLAEDGLTVPQLDQTILGLNMGGGFGRMLDVRMLFSALVDADFLDTEAHFESDANGKRFRDPGATLRADQALSKLHDFIDRLRRQNRAEKMVLEVRRELREHCSNAAAEATGLFTLTAPTGSGKTLAMLDFALRHARKHNLRRVVTVLPYLSIIGQTASTYRSVFEEMFGPTYVLEDHSLSGMGKEQSRGDSEGKEGKQDRQIRLLAENWDAPLIVTTSVQMLESLMSNRSSRCRKLHRLARSVILLDEVQTLPAPLVVSTLATLSHLAREYGSTVVFATATQPAFSHFHKDVSCHSSGGWQPREIVPEASKLFKKTQRTKVQWEDPDQSVTWDKLAQRLHDHRQVLCIVNLKRHAKALWKALEQKAMLTMPLHLSTNLCPAHRLHVIDTVKERLNNQQPVHLIATQCVEAGVDIDFPVVYRSYAPLDAIIQAAGRCNREGNLEGLGNMTVFCPPDEAYPPGGYEQATCVTKMLYRQSRDAVDLDDPDCVAKYYKELYDIGKPAKSKEAQKLDQFATAGSFPDIAQDYRLIKQNAINVVVPYSEQRIEFDSLKDEAERKGLTADWIRRARQLTVSLYRPKDDDTIWDALISVQQVHGVRKKHYTQEWFVYAVEEHYHHNLGLVPPDSLHTWIA